MSDPRAPLPPGSPDDELLSAYLADDLDAATAAALEDRLASEPALAQRLDHTAQVMSALRGIDEVDLPLGAGERVRARLATQRSQPTEPAPPRSATPRKAHRRRRQWTTVGSVAAGVVAFALLAGGVLTGGDVLTGGADNATREAPADGGAEEAGRLDSAEPAPEPAPESLEQSRRDMADEDTPQAADGGADGRSEQREAPANGPVILDTAVRLDDERSVRQRFRELPEAVRLLGEPRAAATDRATAYRAEVADAPAFRSGASPDECLEEAGSAEAGVPLVPARVESVVYDGRAAVAYVLVTADEGSPTLNRVQAWLMAPADCATRLTVDVT